jgi:transcriptional regulator with XRE-family HTH domain
MDVSGTIRDFRIRHGLTQSELGRLSGVPQPVLSAYEHGHRAPTLDTLEAILAVRDETIVVEPAQALQHDRSVARTIEIHRIVLDKLLEDPDHVLEQAEAQLEIMHKASSDRTIPYLDAWRTLLDGPRSELVRVLMSTRQHDVELLKVSPFATLLTDADRAEVARRAVRRRALAS